MMPTEPSADSIEAGVHIFPVRVYYEDTDAGGVVYHSNYLRFAERARTELLRHFGFQQSRLLVEDGISFVIRHCVVDFVAPARLDDQLRVLSRLTRLRGASLDLRQSVARDGLELVRLQVKLACKNISGRPARLPPSVRAAFATLLGNNWSENGNQRG